MPASARCSTLTGSLRAQEIGAHGLTRIAQNSESHHTAESGRMCQARTQMGKVIELSISLDPDGPQPPVGKRFNPMYLMILAALR
jgi:hypothetical protein